MLSLADSFNYLKKFPLAKYALVDNEKSLSSLNFPYFIKASDILHKTEEKAVLKCSSLKEAEENFKLLKKKFPSSKIIIQESVDGIEMIIGLKSDKVFNKLLMIGFGGIQAEVVRDVSFRALPINKKEIEKMLGELRLYPALVTRKKYALDKIIDLAEKISWLNASELDLNPVMLSESQAVIVDARIEL